MVLALRVIARVCMRCCGVVGCGGRGVGRCCDGNAESAEDDAEYKDELSGDVGEDGRGGRSANGEPGADGELRNFASTDVVDREEEEEDDRLVLQLRFVGGSECCLSSSSSLLIPCFSSLDSLNNDLRLRDDGGEEPLLD